jgi:hypothetical protein
MVFALMLMLPLLPFLPTAASAALLLLLLSPLTTSRTSAALLSPLTLLPPVTRWWSEMHRPRRVVTLLPPVLVPLPLPLLSPVWVRLLSLSLL